MNQIEEIPLRGWGKPLKKRLSLQYTRLLFQKAPTKKLTILVAFHQFVFNPTIEPKTVSAKVFNSKTG